MSPSSDMIPGLIVFSKEEAKALVLDAQELLAHIYIVSTTDGDRQMFAH